jgi:predicted permease
MPNLKVAIRTLVKTPFVTIVAILSLALGIGSNAAIFSLFDQMLLRPLPVAHAEELVNLGAPGPKPGSQSCNQAGDCDVVFSYAMFRDLERGQTVFTSIAAHRLFGASLSYSGQTMSGDGMLVSGSYFPVLELTPALGRLLTPDDDRAVDESHVVVLSHAYWQSRFASDPNVVNQTMIVNGETMTIVGVAPRGFQGTTLGAEPLVFVPITMRGHMQPGFRGWTNRQSYWAYLFARLRPGVSIERARAALAPLYAGIINDVEAPLQKGMSPQTLARFKTKTLTLAEGSRGQSGVDREARTPLVLLLSVTGLVLLIACANIANLLLARSAARAGEMAVRLSIGATRGQLIVQLLTESCLLAVCGGVAGVAVARWTLDFIVSMLPPDAASSLAFHVDAVAILFAGALSIGTGILFGLFPALHSTRPDLVSALKGQSGQPSGARAAARFRLALATMQIGLSMFLLVAAGLFTKSLMNVSRVDLGIKADNVITFEISPELNGYKPAASHALFERLEGDLGAVPGVTGVATAIVPLLAGSNWGNNVTVEGFPAGPDTDTNSRFNEIGAGYFRTLGVPLLSGREFTPSDGATAPKVAIVNQAFAKKFNLGRDAVGKRMSQSSGKDAKLDIEIVGLAEDAKYSDVKAATPPVFFIPYRQDPATGVMTFYVRTGLEPTQFFGTIRQIVAKADSNLPIANLRTLPEQIRQNVFLDRMITTLSASFAALATLLAAIGLYGVLAYTVSQRTREIGLRMALGAAPGRVRAMVMRQVAIMTAIGGVGGLVLAVWMGRAAQSLLYQLQGWDPAVLAGAAIALTIVALGAGIVPAHRASRVDPMLALRYD